MIKVTRSAIIDAPVDVVWAVLRDFNSHLDWHPIIASSEIEAGEAPDRIGCVRNFRLNDGNHLREQLLTLSDQDHLATYCILDGTLPMQRYVATLQLKPVTDGNRTFWHWQSTFDVPRGREREFDGTVGDGVYVAGFEGLRAWLRSGSGRSASGNARSATLASGRGEALTGQGIVLSAHGGVEHMSLQAVAAAAPGTGEVRIRQSAIGVNYIDVYVRKGLYRMIVPPAVIGMEAAGTVLDVGPGVSHLLPGDRVAYACLPPGSYCSIRTMAADQVVVLPDDVDEETAAAVMLKGMSAEYLLHRTRRVKPGDTVLVHAAAGGLGLMLCSWASHLGATVIGTVSSDDKARRARESGCSLPIVTGDYQFAEQVLQATRGRGVDVVYDGLGRGAFEQNLESLATCGHWISYGQASGTLDAVPMQTLSSKSITLSRPVLFHYTADRPTLKTIAGNVFQALRDGIIRADITGRYPLGAASQAHEDMEARRTSGQLVLLA